MLSLSKHVGWPSLALRQAQGGTPSFDFTPLFYPELLL